MTKSTTINIAGFDDESIVNGPGIRAVVYAQGCPRRCPGCHNPQTHEFGVGENRTVEELFARIRQNPLVKGVTFSGGEPTAQPEAFAALARLLREANYEIAIYSGSTFEELLASPNPAVTELLKLADVLVDGPYREHERNHLLRFRGSANQRILDLPASLARGEAVPMPSGRWKE